MTLKKKVWIEIGGGVRIGSLIPHLVYEFYLGMEVHQFYLEYYALGFCVLLYSRLLLYVFSDLFFI